MNAPATTPAQPAAIKPLTLQQVFDRGLNGIRKQQYRPSSSGIACMYLSANGDKCLIGHCIDDEALARRMDAASGRGITIVAFLTQHRDEFPELQDMFRGLDHDALGALQAAHDYDLLALRTSAASAFEARMARFAEAHNLVYTPVGATNEQVSA